MADIDLSRYDTDKSPAYLRNYERHFGDLFDQPMRLLELGVQRGGSMLLWRDLLPKAQIAGLDLNKIDVADDSGRIHVYQGFQQDPAVLDRIAAEMAPDGFDVIIDDASHVGEYTEASFWYLFPRYLKPGGLYVLDDWACAYWPEWADGHAYEGVAAFRGTSRDRSTPVVAPGRAEQAKRLVRSAARPVAARLARHPEWQRRMTRLYMRAEGAALRSRFPSHDYGMAGFVKQIVDACAVDVILRGSAPVGLIESVEVTEAQVFVRKRS